MKNNGWVAKLVWLVTVLAVAFSLTGASGAAARASAVSVLVQAADVATASELVRQYGGVVTSELDVINGVGARVPAGAVDALAAAPGVVRVSANAATQLTYNGFEKPKKNVPVTDYPDVTGADLAWQNGVTGKGVTVAVLDTGISNHPKLMLDSKGKSRRSVVGWIDFVDGKRNPQDPNGHGTHIAGIIANAAIGPDGEYNGMAPDVNLISVRVLDKYGSGTYETVIQGLQWVIKNKDRYNIRIVNLSLYAPVQSAYWADPLNQAVMKAWAAGITVIVAAGNSGPDPLTVAVPGNNPYAITVGAYTDAYTPYDWSDDYLAEFSAAGPTLDGFVKPDLLAPGAHITSTMLPGSYIASSHEANWVDGAYFSMAGTSQAAAVTTGAAALVLSHTPQLTPDQVKYRLQLTSMPWINQEQNDVLYSMWQQGAGRLNAYDAVFAQDINGTANLGMDIQADLSGTTHYEGYSYYDDTTSSFRIRGSETLSGGYGVWAGDYSARTGGYGVWAGGYGVWAGGYGVWAGGYGVWAGGYGVWAGGYGVWAGGYGVWAGGYGVWAGGYGVWAGNTAASGYGVWAGKYYDPAFYEKFRSGQTPNIKSSTMSLHWIEEQND